MTVSTMIKGHELFRSFSFEEIARISDFSRTLVYEEDDVVFRHGRTGTHFYVMLNGQLDLLLTATSGKSRLVVGRIEQNEIFGLAPLLGFDHFTTTAKCTGKSEILAVEVEPFRLLLAENTTVSVNVMTNIARTYFSRYINTLRRFQDTLNELAMSASG